MITTSFRCRRTLPADLLPGRQLEPGLSHLLAPRLGGYCKMFWLQGWAPESYPYAAVPLYYVSTACDWIRAYSMEYPRLNRLNSEYRLDVSLFDAMQDRIGGGSRLSLPGGNYKDIDSQLPYTFEVLVGGTDRQPIRFQYSGQAWTSADGPCRVGDYDSGSRNMDCGFSCQMRWRCQTQRGSYAH